MKFFLHSLFVLLVFTFPIYLKADHAMSIDVKLECLDPSLKYYKITIFGYMDCGGIAPVGGLDIVLEPRNPNHSLDPLYRCVMSSLTLDLINVEHNVLPLCNSLVQDCNNPGMPGIDKYIYEGFIYLNCDTDFEIITSICCRSASFTNIFDSEFSILTSRTYIHQADIHCNNSPTFNSLPVAKFCGGQWANYALDAYDIDGDSLAFELITPYTYSAYPIVTYIHGFAFDNPIPIDPQTTFQLNPVTGEITFFPLQGLIQNAIVAIKIKEYRNGVLIGEYVREVIFNILANCDNQLPTLDNISVNGVLQNTTEIIACNNQDLNLIFNFSDINTTQELTLTQNIISLFPNAQITQTGLNPVVFTAFIPASDIVLPAYNIDIKIQDNACPINAFRVQKIKIKKLIINTNPIANQSICEEGSANLYLDEIANADYTYNWNFDNTLSCTACNYTIATPLQNTTYTGVVSNAFCSENISVNVMVNPLPAINFTVNRVDNDMHISWTEYPEMIITINNNVSTFSTSNNLEFLNLPYDSCIIISVQATNIYGCVNTAILNTCVPPCTLQIMNTNSFILCPNETVQLEVANNFVSYLWSNNETNNAIIVDATTSNYAVTVVDNMACSYVYPFEVNSAPELIPNLIIDNLSVYGANDGKIIINLPDTLSQNQYALNGGSFQIDNQFEDLPAGNYIVSIQDEYGCIWNSSAEIIAPNVVVNPQMPTAFSPNGDGENDVFRAVNLPNEYIKSFKIYNRWGNLLFDGKGDMAWNGYYKNDLQSRDIYIYCLEYQTPTDEKSHIIKGEFLLIH